MHPAVPVTVLAATAAVVEWVEHDAESRRRWLTGCVERHASGDWGDLDPDDCRLNDLAAARHDERVLSRYQLPPGHTNDAPDDAVWIITDDLGDTESPTTILWPSDY